MSIELSAAFLSLEQAKQIIIGGQEVVLSPQVLSTAEQAFTWLSSQVNQFRIYGINTGFGPMAAYPVNAEDRQALQYNLVRSHATGMGERLSPLRLRATLLCRLNTLLKGKSAVHPDLLHLMAFLLNQQAYPLIYTHGGVGASGDLVQLAHLALALIGEGEIWWKNECHEAKSCLAQLGASPFQIQIREGLALMNGTATMTGMGICNWHEAERLLSWATLAGALINLLVDSRGQAFSQALNTAKHHPGQQYIALQLLSYMGLKEEDTYESKPPLTESTVGFRKKIQMPYSLRCLPQILGPIHDTLKQVATVLAHELNSVSDNPIIDAEQELIVHGGNFHGDYVALEMDKLRLVMTKLTMLAERQLNFLLNTKVNEQFPPFLNGGTPGLELGLQGLQFTATSTTAENQSLVHPIYTHSIPCNQDNQDLVSMGANAALMTQKTIDNAFEVMATLFMAIRQTYTLSAQEKNMNPFCEKIFDTLSDRYPEHRKDLPLYPFQREMLSLLRQSSPDTYLQELKTTAWMR